MAFRFRIGPFTFGSSGIRLSLWSSGSGVSVPLSGKGNTYGKVKVGPVSYHFNNGNKGESWKGEPATKKQKDYADSLGIKYPGNVTKGQLSELISMAKK
jgi:hypothetical protein